MPSNLANQQGFTLLEAIVSLVLISTIGALVYSWINSNLIAVGRVQSVNERALATQNTLAFLENLNPVEQPVGEREFVGYFIRWESKPLKSMQDGIAGMQGVGLYKVGLFDVHVDVLTEDRRPWFELDFHQVGYKQVREKGLPF